MDPAGLAIVLDKLAPVLAVFMTFACPVSIIWAVKHFKLRERELLLEEKRAPTDERMRALEARLSALEAALLAGSRAQLGDRRELLEGPATSSQATSPDPLRTR